MKKQMSLSEIKANYGQNCFEAENSFGLGLFGKYLPNMTVFIPKDFDLNSDESLVDPLGYISDTEVTDNMNLQWDGEASLLFGDYWVSKAEKPCFRLQNPLQAKHLLVRASWGGAFNSTRGVSESYAKRCGALYFRSARSNGGGSGFDYWILPVGYVLKQDEADNFSSSIDVERGKAYCQKHANLLQSRILDAERAIKERAIAEEDARKNRDALLPKLNAVESRLNALRNRGCQIDEFEIGEAYFKIGFDRLIISESNIQSAEARVERLEKWVEEIEQKKKAQDLQNIQMAAETERRLLAEAETKAKADAEAKAKASADAEAKAAGLPSDVKIWHRNGATNAGQGWVISPNGVDRDYDTIDNPRPKYSDEGYGTWNQILSGEVVLRWAHAFTAADHEFEVIFQPTVLTEAQIDRIAEIQCEIEDAHFGKLNGAGTRSCPSIGKGWGLF